MEASGSCVIRAGSAPALSVPMTAECTCHKTCVAAAWSLVCTLVALEAVFSCLTGKSGLQNLTHLHTHSQELNIIIAIVTLYWLKLRPNQNSAETSWWFWREHKESRIQCLTWVLVSVAMQRMFPHCFLLTDPGSVNEVLKPNAEWTVRVVVH